MKKIIVLSLSIGLLFASCKSDKKVNLQKSANEETSTLENKASSPDVEKQTHFVDVKDSKLLWKGFKPTGSHNGTAKLKEGGILYEGKILKEGFFVFDMTSLIDLDLPQEDEYNQKLITHLTSPDFFDTQAYPTALFTITNVLTEASQTKITGDLTIKGITKSISFPVTISEKDAGLQLIAEPFMIDRTQFDIKYKSNKFFDNLKDKFINDEFEISFDLYLK